MDVLFELVVIVGRTAGVIAVAMTAYQLGRRRDIRSVDVFLAVASAALPLWLGALKLETLRTVLFAAQPYLLLRLVRYFRPVWPPILYFGLALAVFKSAVRLRWLPPDPVWEPILAVWTSALVAYVVIAFATEARRASGVSARRLRLAAVGSTIVLLAAMTYPVGRGSDALDAFFGELSRPAFALILLYFYFAFATPKWLRARWQQLEIARYLIEEAAQDAEVRGRRAAEALATAAARTASTTVVLVMLRDRPDADLPLRVRAATIPALLDTTVQVGTGALGRACSSGTAIDVPSRECESPLGDRLRDLGTRVLVAPIVAGSHVWGAVLIAQRRGSLFPEDDLKVLGQLARYAGSVLDYAYLAAEQRERERRAADRRIRDVESRVALMLESIKDYALLIIDDGGRVASWQPGAEHVFGYREAEIRDQPAAPLFNLSNDELQLRLNEARDRGLAEYEGACRRKDGTAFTGQTVIRRMVVDGAAEGGFVAVTCDVTERRLLAERLRHSEKLEAVGVLAGGVAHDFNNLLAAIIGYAGLIQMNLDKADPNQQHVEEIQVVAERAAGLTEQLLAFSRRQALKSAVVDLSALVDELLPILRSLVGSQVEVVHEPGSVWPITADPSQIDRVLVNLATNARDAMPTGGTLTIRTSNVMLDAAGAGTEVTPGHYVLLEVTDTGVGMDDATRARIFEPFFSTREMGRGLGLAAVYGIVRQMQGTIRVESRPQKGATFRLYFPRGDAQRAEDRPTAAPDGLGRGGSLLLVEDDASVRSYLCQLLEREGFRVLAADQQASALQLVAGSNDPLALIITDVMMADGGGPALVKAVERIRPGVPALYISGHLDAVHASGMPTPAHFLQKPFSSDELLTRVRQILSSRS